MYDSDIELVEDDPKVQENDGKTVVIPKIAPAMKFINVSSKGNDESNEFVNVWDSDSQDSVIMINDDRESNKLNTEIIRQKTGSLKMGRAVGQKEVSVKVPVIKKVDSVKIISSEHLVNQGVKKVPNVKDVVQPIEIDPLSCAETSVFTIDPVKTIENKPIVGSIRVRSFPIVTESDENVFDPVTSVDGDMVHENITVSEEPEMPMMIESNLKPRYVRKRRVKHIEEDTEDIKTTIHNFKERVRRSKIKKQFVTLSRLVPNDLKPSKLSILDKAKQMIQQLKRAEFDYLIETEKLLQENYRLQCKLDNLSKNRQTRAKEDTDSYLTDSPSNSPPPKKCTDTKEKSETDNICDMDSPMSPDENVESPTDIFDTLENQT